MGDRMERIIKIKHMMSFVCDGKFCKGSCCCDSWGIDIDDNTIKKYRGLANEDLRRKLDEYITYYPEYDRYFMQRLSNNKCPFLDKDYLCMIQRLLGEEYISDICATYPRKYLDFGDYMTESIGLSCPLAVSELLDCHTTLKFQICKGDVKRINLVKNKRNNTIIADKWYEVQRAGIKVLQNKELSVRENNEFIYVGGGYSKNI